MLFRIALAALLTIALNVVAIANCRVGEMTAKLTATSETQQHQHHQDNGKADCGKTESRVCDGMVQFTPSLQPQVAPPTEVAVPPILVQPATQRAYLDPLAHARPAWRPPDRAASSKTVLARTGRLLV